MISKMTRPVMTEYARRISAMGYKIPSNLTERRDELEGENYFTITYSPSDFSSSNPVPVFFHEVCEKLDLDLFIYEEDEGRVYELRLNETGKNKIRGSWNEEVDGLQHNVYGVHRKPPADEYTGLPSTVTEITLNYANSGRIWTSTALFKRLSDSTINYIEDVYLDGEIEESDSQSFLRDPDDDLEKIGKEWLLENSMLIEESY